LRPIAHRTLQQQQALTLICARGLMVRLRTAAVNAVRGLTKSCGHRMPASTTVCFAKRGLAMLPTGLAPALGPVLEQIAEMTTKIKQLKGGVEALKVERLARDLRVTKGSFYWHFKDRDELCELLLREWEEELPLEIIPQVGKRRSRKALQLLLQLLVKRGEKGILPSDAAMFTWAAVSHRRWRDGSIEPSGRGSNC
jgi:transposase